VEELCAADLGQGKTILNQLKMVEPTQRQSHELGITQKKARE